MKKNSILLTLSATLLIALASLAWAHEKVKLTGYVVDVVCFAAQANGKPEEANKAAAEHTKDCALMADCVKGGYGIYADSKWYPFDAKGNELAKALFEKITKKDHLKMTVEGMTHDGKILVQTLTEAQ
jgi:hypothetical protein